MAFQANMSQIVRKKHGSMDYRLDKPFSMSGFVKMETNVDFIINGMSSIGVEYMREENNQFKNIKTN